MHKDEVQMGSDENGRGVFCVPVSTLRRCARKTSTTIWQGVTRNEAERNTTLGLFVYGGWLYFGNEGRCFKIPAATPYEDSDCTGYRKWFALLALFVWSGPPMG